MDDIDTVCKYLLTKPTGASSAEARAVIDKKCLDGRKLSALKFWGLIEDQGGKLKLTENGRAAMKDSGAKRYKIFQDIIRNTQPYMAVIERALHSGEVTFTTVEVAAHWHEHFKAHTSDSERILNDQAVCFFQIVEGADLGKITIGRRGQPTRIDFSIENIRKFIGDSTPSWGDYSPDNVANDIEVSDAELSSEVTDSHHQPPVPPQIHRDTQKKGNRVFITHGKNEKILQEVKEMLSINRFEPVIAKEHETAAKPVPEKVMEDMRSCRAAVIHVASEGVLYDEDEKEYPQINGNVLIEIGAAMALYGNKGFILLVEEGVKLPSNLQGLYECRYQGKELTWDAAKKLMKALQDFE